MRLTAYTDFSLRVLMYLALHPDRRPTIAECGLISVQCPSEAPNMVLA